MTKYWEEPTVRYRPGPTSATAQTARMQLPRTSRTASIPAPAHHRVHRHPATAVVPTQPSTAKAKAEPKPKPKPEAKKSENRFFNDVEGLRGIAVALVVLFHAGVPHMAGGFVGVDVFF